MIQRIQTILLALAAIFNSMVLFLPVANVSETESMESTSATLYGSHISVTGFDEIEGDWGTPVTIGASEELMVLIHMALVILISVFLFVLIFLYQDRVRQGKLGYIGIVMLMVQTVIAALLYMRLPEMVGINVGDELVNNDIAFGFFFPVVALLLTFGAVRRISADEKLVRSSDRIR